VGSLLAGQGERQGLVFHFEVLDDAEINAFALPGGFVYITRGLLERLSSEDELAMVLGHEIGHVTARHGAARLSTLYALQYGSLAGVIVSPRTFGNYGNLIDLALQVGMSAYSREQESQADALGVSYAFRAGYRADAGLTVLKILAWLEGKEPGRLERWFRSHPPPAERQRDVEAALAGLQPSGDAPRELTRDPYLRAIDGLLVGAYNGSEMVVKDTYLNRDHAVALPVRPGWEVALDPNAALVTMRQGKQGQEEFASLEATPLSRAIDAAAVEREFDESLRRRGWRRAEGGHEASTQQQVPARVALYEGTTAANEPTGVLKAFLVHGKHAWSLTVSSRRALFDQHRTDYEAWALSLRFLDPTGVAAFGEPRVRLVPAGPDASWPSLAASLLGDPAGAERLAFYNGLDPVASISPSLLVKVPPSLAMTARPE